MEETRDMAEAPIADNIDNDDVEINDLSSMNDLIEESRELDKMIDKLCLKRKENSEMISRLTRLDDVIFEKVTNVREE